MNVPQGLRADRESTFSQGERLAQVTPLQMDGGKIVQRLRCFRMVRTQMPFPYSQGLLTVKKEEVPNLALLQSVVNQMTHR